MKLRTRKPENAGFRSAKTRGARAERERRLQHSKAHPHSSSPSSTHAPRPSRLQSHSARSGPRLRRGGTASPQRDMRSNPPTCASGHCASQQPAARHDHVLSGFSSNGQQPCGGIHRGHSWSAARLAIDCDVCETMSVPWTAIAIAFELRMAAAIGTENARHRNLANRIGRLTHHSLSHATLLRHPPDLIRNGTPTSPPMHPVAPSATVADVDRISCGSPGLLPLLDSCAPEHLYEQNSRRLSFLSVRSRASAQCLRA